MIPPAKPVRENIIYLFGRCILSTKLLNVPFDFESNNSSEIVQKMKIIVKPEKKDQTDDSEIRKPKKKHGIMKFHQGK
jgi:hypothetical protein